MNNWRTSKYIGKGFRHSCPKDITRARKRQKSRKVEIIPRRGNMVQSSLFNGIPERPTRYWNDQRDQPEASSDLLRIYIVSFRVFIFNYVRVERGGFQRDREIHDSFNILNPMGSPLEKIKREK